MDQSALVSLLIGLAGSGASTGICIAIANHYLSREKLRAEAQKLEAEAEETRVRAEEGRIRITQQLAKASLPELVDNAETPLPPGWRTWGDDVGAYEIGRDTETVHNGSASGYVKWRHPNNGFGTMMQVFRADNFKGQRLRLSAYAKTSNVTGWAGIWMRVDGLKDALLGFDNMQQRPIKGTTDWTKYEVVLDVPQKSEQIAFGFLLAGRGQLWCTGLDLQAVSRGVPTTDLTPEMLSSDPVNLDFSQ
ncbi:hypothetical protein ACMDCR_08915 [Labrys okinawensis]|uniref:hypothetical protein n=1 Tax=Labrys okinawensis TaxID=346911 RepID=UPI0039BD326E